MSKYDDVLAANPEIDNQLPPPWVVEATDDVINLDVPFTLEMPVIDTTLFNDVILSFISNEGSDGPQVVVYLNAVADEPSRYVVDNSTLSPPFNRDHSAVLQAFLRVRDSSEWRRTPDSAIYTF